MTPTQSFDRAQPVLHVLYVLAVIVVSFACWLSPLWLYLLGGVR